MQEISNLLLKIDMGFCNPSNLKFREQVELSMESDSEKEGKGGDG
jgi:hypothetical protein